ncbi:GNAT family N-acetyltransferase [Bacillus carboniphilus]|uniref:GNAT family N-acetyltransferase n=1 Tax=Bacillus carboniphilus TaxID=86663 RepID=A0ABP3G576_9BACI
MFIRLATKEDLPGIMDIIKKSVELMEANDNDQWTGYYPQEEHFLEDIDNQVLYVAELDRKIVGSVSVDQSEPEEYASVNWRKSGEAYLFHRLAVDPETRGKGVASQLITFAEKTAAENDVFYMKVDTYSLNNKAQTLFEKLGYEKRGTIYLYGKEQPFYCYDKILSIHAEEGVQPEQTTRY